MDRDIDLVEEWGLYFSSTHTTNRIAQAVAVYAS